MRITERLNVEHGVFLRQIADLEGRLLRGEPVEVLQGIVGVIMAAERPHRDIEDRLLYPALLEHFGSNQALDDLEAEHQEIDRLARLVSGPLEDALAIGTLCRALRSHIEKEIHALFPLVEEWVPKPRLEAMCDFYLEHVYERSLGRASRGSQKWLE